MASLEKQSYQSNSVVSLSHTQVRIGTRTSVSTKFVSSPFLIPNREAKALESASPSSSFPDLDQAHCKLQLPFKPYPSPLRFTSCPLPPDPRTPVPPQGGLWEGWGCWEHKQRGRRMCVTGSVGRGRAGARGNPGPALAAQTPK